jgi:hypothetical protein
MSMTKMFKRSTLLAAVLAGFVILACSPMKEPAEAALADANAALQQVAPDGLKYAPAEYATVNEQVTAMKAAFDKQDYQAVLNMVHKLAPNLKMLAGTIANKKSEATMALKDQWTHMSSDVPKSIAAVETRIAELSKTHKLPKGVSKDALAGAGAAADAAKQGWSDAQSARTSGNIEDAVAKGKATEAKLSDLMASLGMNSPSAAAK